MMACVVLRLRSARPYSRAAVALGTRVSALAMAACEENATLAAAQGAGAHPVLPAPFRGGEPAGLPADVPSGLLTDDGEAQGRPGDARSTNRAPC